MSESSIKRLVHNVTLMRALMCLLMLASLIALCTFVLLPSIPLVTAWLVVGFALNVAYMVHWRRPRELFFVMLFWPAIVVMLVLLNSERNGESIGKFVGSEFFRVRAFFDRPGLAY